MAQDSELLIQIHSELKLLIQKVESAFPKDENDEVDYQGHRQFHKTQNDAAKQYKDSKAAIIRNIITWASIGLLTVITSSIAESHILPVLLSVLKATH